MFYVYVIRSEQLGRYYIGQTSDLKRRIWQHKTGLSKYTSQATDWTIVYYEAYTSRSLAIRREMKLKPRARAFQELIKRIIDESGEG
jgi:putative endonuclease